MTAAIELSELEPDVESGQNIVPRLTVAEVVRVYQEATRDIRGAFAKITAAEKRLNDTFKMEEMFAGIHVPNRHVDYSRADHELKELRNSVWSCIIDRLEIKRMMSIKAAAELDRQVKDGELPEITIENVSSVAAGFAGNLDKMLADAVDEIFEWLRPHRSEYKTNTEFEVGRKVILRWSVEWGWRGRNAVDNYGYRVQYHRDQHFRALENVFNALDGRGSITKTHHSRLADAINGCGSDGRFETELFKGRCFRNKNLHLEFKRLDLLKRFNALAGGKRLKPANG